MLNSQGLDLLLEAKVDKNAISVIVYSPQISERLDFTCSFIFERVLKVKYILTDNIDEFNASNFCKINYSQETFAGIVQILPQKLLVEDFISDKKPQPVFRNEMIYFFSAQQLTGKEQLPYDIFSSVFYFMSRYEEWQVFEKDRHLRFEAKESLLYRHGFHLKPVVDIWIQELKQLLENVYQISFPLKKFQVISTIDVDNVFAYRGKGFTRTIGAGLRDLVKFDFKNLGARIKVLSGQAKDPFDVYGQVAEFCFEEKIPLIWFFLLRTGTTYDRTLNPRSNVFKNIFGLLKINKSIIGLHPSYDAAFEEERMSREIKMISEQLGQGVKISRQHFLRFDIRTTPNLLSENGILTDCSMGFASSPGFRAGTSHPFFYFDFSKEKRSELLFLPFCAMDGAYFVYDKTGPDETLVSMISLAAEVKKAGGFFVTVFHERTFSNHLYPGFGTLYKNLHLRLKQL